MSRLPLTIAVVFAGLWLSGCASSPWSAQSPASVLPSTPTAAGSTASPASSAASHRPDPQKMQDVMAEVRQLGTFDPVAQDRLLEDLRESDPSLWPLVMQQFRATAAYRRRAMERVAAERLPPVNDVAVAPTEAPPGPYPRTSEPPMQDQAPADQASNQVAQASYTAPVADDWRQRLAGAIAALEAEVPSSPTTPAAQQLLAKELEGLAAKSAESAPLVVRNLAFCTEVQSYGCAKRFEKYEFEPNQEVLLYAEVENFASEPTAKGYHTSLKSSYKILDARGQRVAENAFAATEEYCGNRRRDFFIGYHLRLPKGIGPGKYTLQLSIEDLKCRKAGRAAIEFEAKAEGGGRKAERGKGEKELRTGPESAAQS